MVALTASMHQRSEYKHTVHLGQREKIEESYLLIGPDE